MTRSYTPMMGHPMEVFPWLRRFPRSQARDLLYTLLQCVLTTVFFSLIRFPETEHADLRNVVILNGVFSLSIGYSIHLSTMLLGRTLARWFPNTSHGSRATCMVLTAIFAAAFGFWLASVIVDVSVRAWSGMMIVSVQVAAAVVAIAIAQMRFRTARFEFERERSARLEAERLMTLSRLQMLQAQIEPHFLFNTLANVSSLIEIEPWQARKMLDQFTFFLRASLDQTRKPTTQLRAEFEVVEAYLSVLKVRMGERLNYRVTAPQELLSLEVPAMLLQPMVENAVKHGIEPRLNGGTVEVEVRQEDGSLIFIVTDDGVGFVPSKKENVGLGAVRERLAVQFGAAAELQIERTAEQLTRVTIRIPIAK